MLDLDRKVAVTAGARRGCRGGVAGYTGLLEGQVVIPLYSVSPTRPIRRVEFDYRRLFIMFSAPLSITRSSFLFLVPCGVSCVVVRYLLFHCCCIVCLFDSLNLSQTFKKNIRFQFRKKKERKK